MKKMKRSFLILMCIGMLTVLAACGNNDAADGNVNDVTNGTTEDGNVVDDVVDGVGNGVNDVVDGVEDGVDDLTDENAGDVGNATKTN